MSRPWKKTPWPRAGANGKKSYLVGYYDHERVERTKTCGSASLARDWMRDYSAASQRGEESLRRFLRCHVHDQRTGFRPTLHLEYFVNRG